MSFLKGLPLKIFDYWKITLENERALVAICEQLDVINILKTGASRTEEEVEREIRRLKKARIELCSGFRLPPECLRPFQYGWLPPENHFLSAVFDGQSSSNLSSELGVTIRTIDRWKSGDVAIPYAPWRLFIEHRNFSASEIWSKRMFGIESKCRPQLNPNKTNPLAYQIILGLQECKNDDELNDIVEIIEDYYKSIGKPEYLATCAGSDVRLDLAQVENVDEDEVDSILFLDEIEAIQNEFTLAEKRLYRKDK